MLLDLFHSMPKEVHMVIVTGTSFPQTPYRVFAPWP